MTIKEKFKKFACFFIIVLYLMGAIGGFGFALYGGSVPCAIGVVVLALLAFPTAQRAFMYLKS